VPSPYGWEDLANCPLSSRVPPDSSALWFTDASCIGDFHPLRKRIAKKALLSKES
jgi:hypothetical protein